MPFIVDGRWYLVVVRIVDFCMRANTHALIEGRPSAEDGRPRSLLWMVRGRREDRRFQIVCGRGNKPLRRALCKGAIFANGCFPLEAVRS